jgi:hypothetical protein
VKLGSLRGMPDSLVPGTIRFDPKLRIFGNHLVVVHVWAPFVCINQLIVDLRLLNQLATTSLIDGTL